MRFRRPAQSRRVNGDARQQDIRRGNVNARRAEECSGLEELPQPVAELRQSLEIVDLATTLDQLIGSFENPKQIFESDTSLNGGPDAASKRQMRQMIAKLRATYIRATTPKKSVLDRHLTRLAALYQ